MVNGFALGINGYVVDPGAHIVLFYNEEDELLEVFPHYFAEGLKNNECCVVIYPHDNLKEKITSEIAKIVPIEKYVSEKKIEFVHYKKFYFEKDQFKDVCAYKHLDKKLNHVDYNDVDGVRGAGDMSWIRTGSFKDIVCCEKGLTEKCAKNKVVLMCSYPLKLLKPWEIIEIVQSHALILYKSGKKWQLSETIERKIMQNEIEDLEKFTKLAIGREIRMSELKKEINELKAPKKK